MTKRLWQLHSWLGLIAGLALLVIGVTGSLLVFANELEMLFNPESIRVKSVEAQRLPMNTLLEKANRSLSGYEIVGWELRHDEPHLADVLWVIAHGSDQWQVAMLDPYSAKVLASPRKPRATLTGLLLELHYTWFADHTGMLITAFFAVLLCALGITGVWLYRDFWGNFFRLRWRASSRIFFSDLHKTVGISSVAFNLLLGFTGAYWNFTHVIGEWIQGEHKQSKMTRPLYADSISLDGLIAESAKRLPGFRANFISPPTEPDSDITLWGTLPTRNPLRGDFGSTVVFDAQTGVFKESTDIREAGWWAQFVDMFAPLHYGSFGGLLIKILWCIGGLAPGALAVSGFVIWWMRTRRSQVRKTLSRHDFSTA